MVIPLLGIWRVLQIFAVLSALAVQGSTGSASPPLFLSLGQIQTSPPSLSFQPTELNFWPTQPPTPPDISARTSAKSPHASPPSSHHVVAPSDNLTPQPLPRDSAPPPLVVSLPNIIPPSHEFTPSTPLPKLSAPPLLTVPLPPLSFVPPGSSSQPPLSSAAPTLVEPVPALPADPSPSSAPITSSEAPNVTTPTFDLAPLNSSQLPASPPLEISQPPPPPPHFLASPTPAFPPSALAPPPHRHPALPLPAFPPRRSASPPLSPHTAPPQASFLPPPSNPPKISTSAAGPAGPPQTSSIMPLASPPTQGSASSPSSSVTNPSPPLLSASVNRSSLSPPSEPPRASSKPSNVTVPTGDLAPLSSQQLPGPPPLEVSQSPPPHFLAPSPPSALAPTSHPHSALPLPAFPVPHSSSPPLVPRTIAPQASNLPSPSTSLENSTSGSPPAPPEPPQASSVSPLSSPPPLNLVTPRSSSTLSSPPPLPPTLVNRSSSSPPTAPPPASSVRPLASPAPLDLLNPPLPPTPVNRSSSSSSIAPPLASSVPPLASPPPPDLLKPLLPPLAPTPVNRSSSSPHTAPPQASSVPPLASPPPPDLLNPPLPPTPVNRSSSSPPTAPPQASSVPPFASPPPPELPNPPPSLPPTPVNRSSSLSPTAPQQPSSAPPLASPPPLDLLNPPPPLPPTSVNRTSSSPLAQPPLASPPLPHLASPPSIINPPPPLPPIPVNRSSSSLPAEAPQASFTPRPGFSPTPGSNFPPPPSTSKPSASLPLPTIPLNSSSPPPSLPIGPPQMPSTPAPASPPARGSATPPSSMSLNVSAPASPPSIFPSTGSASPPILEPSNVSSAPHVSVPPPFAVPSHALAPSPQNSAPPPSSQPLILAPPPGFSVLANSSHPPRASEPPLPSPPSPIDKPPFPSSPSVSPASHPNHTAAPVRSNTSVQSESPSVRLPPNAPAIQPIAHGRSPSILPGFIAPSHSSSSVYDISPVPSQDITVPHGVTMTPFSSPKISPSGSSTRKANRPRAPPILALPPPPPNQDCSYVTCTEPLTNKPPGSPCGCVLPIQVGLRIGIALYTFFPLVPELAKEIGVGTFMKQNQVRIMGANAASEEPDETDLLVDLIPLGDKFDNITALLVYQQFWGKKVAIKKSLFGDYEVRYVNYPGLPPSPPAPDFTAFDGRNGSIAHPLGVDIAGQEHKKRLSGSLIAIIVLSSVGALFVFLAVGWVLLFRHERHISQSASTPLDSLPSVARMTGPPGQSVGSGPSSSLSFGSSAVAYTGSAKTLSASEIEKATNNFNTSGILGEGGFGRVHSGALEDGTQVAVKVLKREDQQGGREFLAEVEMLSRLHHRNLVKLIGICVDERMRCLVYELIPNGSVESHLHGVDKETAPLDWGARLKIALGAARGLAYLHEDSSPRVIHRDFKSSNILLEHDFTPKVSDFGLARTALDEENRHISTRVMGTFGYVAPEYAMTGHLLVKSDVYSYGVVLLELLTGRKPVDMSQEPGQENLVAWARPFLSSREGLQMIVDPMLLQEQASLDSIAKVAAIASMCVQPEVSHRPFMGEVVQALKLVCNECDSAREDLDEYEETPPRSCSTNGNLSSEMVVDPVHSQNSVVHKYGSGPADVEKGLSVSDVLSGPGGRGSESFWRHSSSGPIKASRSQRFWQRTRKLTSREAVSEHGVMYRFWSGSH